MTASPTSAVAAAPSTPTLAADVPIVVIDAGHGGGDPGAVGSGGTQEKTVTLAAAVELAEQLKKRGRYKVVLTRASVAEAKGLTPVGGIRILDRLVAAAITAGGSGSVTSPIPRRMIFAAAFSAANLLTRRPIAGKR